jgi:hypothetical protein
MTAKLALLKRIAVLENAPTAAKPLCIRGGLPGDFSQSRRATIKLPTGHIVLRERAPNESLNSFISRIHTPGATVVIGGLPPLPLDPRP